ncbi:SDR family NAD(P)-dependent oxidoreductase [Sinorhizobium sp. 7-81]|uniref:SDR family NAD(P)-dependent oxidoreductase n=1 Tax=Sinorhizobium sp. 8-89 TaxID=3049089 RepID=UPI0024C37C9A|nr:SDR family NAD(P)-dependent oxidoreductase [Sinorhizobium sp. 8-89]MDK1490169.1 SDR family NAD(P)-dependent oxidoreductase [Sinorhizobium sp. 8-89]
MKLIDQVAVVTGAGRNIGEATVKLLAREGASIAVTDIDAERAGRVAEEIRAAGGTAEVFLANVADEEGVISLVRGVADRFGKVDILVNNVAISDNKHILDVTKEEWDRVIAVTLTGTFLMSKYFSQQMVAQGHGGNIVNVGSTSGFYGRPRAVAYTAAKAGVTNLSRSLAIQLAKHKIRVNCVVPNKIGSPVGKDTFDPTRPVLNLRDRPGVPDDLARAILFLVSADSDFIDGTTLFVDGGVSALMPGSE